MVALKDFTKDTIIYLFILLLAVFFMVNLSDAVGKIYLGIAVFGVVGYYIVKDQGHRIPPIDNQRTTWFSALIVGVVAYAAFLFLTSQVLSAAGFEYNSMNSVIGLVADTFSSTPVLEGNSFWTFLTWGQYIPFNESAAFFVVLPTLILLLIGGTLYSKIDLRAIIVIILTSAGFVLFHLQAKGITDNAALLTTFIFALISMALVYYYKEGKQAITFHLVSNSLAIAYTLGWLGNLIIP